MKVLVDLDPRDVWRIQEKAERQGVQPGEVLRDELATRRYGRELREAVRQRVFAKYCDADIAAELGHAPGYIAEVRRGLGLPANRRYDRSVHCVNGHDQTPENTYTEPSGRERCRACRREWSSKRRTA